MKRGAPNFALVREPSTGRPMDSQVLDFAYDIYYSLLFECAFGGTRREGAYLKEGCDVWLHITHFDQGDNVGFRGQFWLPDSTREPVA